MVFFIKSGRGERIRTFDTLVPNQVLYQTELHPESETYYNTFFIKSKYIFQGAFIVQKIKEIKPLVGVFKNQLFQEFYAKYFIYNPKQF